MKRYLDNYFGIPMGINFNVIILVALCILSFEPYFIWPFRQYLYFLALPLFLNIRIFDKTNLPYAAILSAVLVFYFLDLNRLYTFYSSLAFQLYFLFILPFFTQMEMKQVYRLVVLIIACIYALGIPLFIIDRLFDLPYFIVSGRIPGNEVPSFRCYVFFVQAVNDIDLYPRFRSVFDEAGVVGTTSLILLTGNRFKLDSWQYIVIFIGGIISFSFFFYLASLIIFTFFHLKKVKLVLTGIAILLISYLTFQDNKIFKTLILDRLQLGDNKLAGDNRTSPEWDYEYSNFIKSDAIYTGNGMESYNSVEFPDIASYQTFIYEYGIIGFVLIVIYFLLLMTRMSGNINDKLILFLAFMLVFYQRPWIFDFYYPTLLYAISANFSYQSYTYYSFKNSPKIILKSYSKV